jgi:hypothetical protein
VVQYRQQERNLMDIGMNYFFHKRPEISWPAERLLATQEGLYSVKLLISMCINFHTRDGLKIKCTKSVAALFIYLFAFSNLHDFCREGNKHTFPNLLHIISKGNQFNS